MLIHRLAYVEALPVERAALHAVKVLGGLNKFGGATCAAARCHLLAYLVNRRRTTEYSVRVQPTT